MEKIKPVGYFCVSEMASCVALVASLLFAVTTISNLASAVPVEGSTCRFPQFILNRPRWEKDIKDERRKTTQFIKFTENTVSITDLSSTVPNDILYEVVQCTGDSKFLMREKSTENYFCVDILKRSENVFQWKKSKMTKTLDSMLCKDANLILDEQPFVWPFMDSDHYEKFPLEGGYTMKIYDHETDSYLCSDYWMKPNFESECVYGDGIQLNFRHFDCVGSLGMNMLQDLHSLASWNDGVFKYSVIVNDDDLWPKLWILRMHNNDLESDTLKLDVFPEIVTTSIDDPKDRKYFSWYLAKIHKTPCEDELSEVCIMSGAAEEACDETQKVRCKKTCGQCDTKSSSISNDCSFLKDIKGVWRYYLTDDHTDNTITFEEDNVKLSDKLPSFHCMNVTEKNWVKRANRKPLQASFQNGCQARVLCMEAEKRAPQVMHFRLSHVTRNYDDFVDVNELCLDKHFENSKEKNHILKKTFSSTPSTILIKERTKSTNGRYVDCGTNETIYLTHGNSTNKLNIRRTGLGSGIASHTVVNETCLSTSNPSHPGKLYYFSSWKCLAHFEWNLNKFLIVETDDRQISNSLQCWIRHKTAWSPTVHFYVVKPSVCYDNIAIDIHIGKYTHHLAEFTVTKVKQDRFCNLRSLETVRGNGSGESPHVTSNKLMTSHLPESENILNSNMFISDSCCGLIPCWEMLLALLASIGLIC